MLSSVRFQLLKPPSRKSSVGTGLSVAALRWTLTMIALALAPGVSLPLVSS